MKINLDRLFDNSFVITYENDRYSQFKTCFDYYHLRQPKKFDAYVIKDEKYFSLNLGHISIIKMAKALNLDYVMIFEDDAYPCDDINNKLDWLQKNELDDNIGILLLGWWNENDGFGKELSIAKLDKLCGSHAYIIFKKAYDQVINIFHNNIKWPTDSILQNGYGCNQYKMLCTNTPLFITLNQKRSGISNMLGYAYNGKRTLNPPISFKDFNIIKTSLNQTLKIATFHYQNNELTNACINNIIKCFKKMSYTLTVYDNSPDRNKFILSNENRQVNVTVKNIYDDMLKSLKDIEMPSGDYMHAFAINDFIYSNRNSKCLIFDTDFMLQKEPDFIDLPYDIIGTFHLHRYLPCMLLINTENVISKNIIYHENVFKFDKNTHEKINGLTNGYSFYDKILSNGLTHKSVNYNFYGKHMCSGSWTSDKDKVKKFIDENILK